MNSGQGDNLEEAVPESLKNILLVMADGGFLSPPSEGLEQTSELWVETCKRVDRFLPNLIGEIFPQTDAAASEAQPPPENGGSGKPRQEQESDITSEKAKEEVKEGE